MPSRRRFIQCGTAALALPYLSRGAARAATSVVVRRDVMEMADDDPFFADYAKAVQKMHELSNDNRNWAAQARIHADHCHHGEIEFLHWHRHYVRFFEKICAALCGNPQFALPYWNWSKNSGRIPSPFFDRPELNVEHWNDPGRYDGAAWGPVDTVGRRGLDETRGLLDDPTRGGNFTAENIDAIKQFPDSDSFWSALEGGPHNTAHVMAGATRSGKGGHIGSGLSPLDPIFWLHHCMVDRVWAEWQKSGHSTPDPQADYAGNFFEADGSAAQANSRTAMSIADLGYDYDVFQVAALPALEETQMLSTFSAAQISGIERLAKGDGPQVLGASANSRPSAANVQTKISVDVPALKSHATDLSALKAAGIMLGERRILARLSDIRRPEADDLVVNVFVDCPYLSPSTPYSDPHYAGTFSFFGMPRMGGMDGMGSSFLIDITKPVREAGLPGAKVGVQLMPVPAHPDATSTSTFQVGKIEIVRV